MHRKYKESESLVYDYWKGINGKAKENKRKKNELNRKTIK